MKCAEEAGLDQKSVRNNINENIKFYFGETFRDANTRGAEHQSDYNSRSEDSHMMKHLSDNHPDCSPKDIKFGISVVKSHKSSFERMTFESILIFRGGKNVLNSKSEFSRCVVPRLSVMVGDDDKEDIPLVFEKKILNKRLSDEEANVGYAKKKRKCNNVKNVLSQANLDEKKDSQIDSITNDELEETSPMDLALDNENANVMAPTNLDKIKLRKPNPSKKKTKKSNSKETGQPKISFYFSNTKEGKPVWKDFTTNPT